MLSCLQQWHRREQVVPRTLLSWFEIARHKSTSHEFTTVVVLLHSVDPFRRGRGLACFQRRFVPRTKLEHPKRLDLVVSLPPDLVGLAPDPSRLPLPQIVSLLVFSNQPPPPTSSRISQFTSSPLFSPTSVLHSFSLDMLSSSSTVFRLFPSILTSRLRVLDLPDVHHRPSSFCPACWIHCPLRGCLFSLRRHCCLNSMPVPRCCSNSLLLAHPCVLPPGSTSFGLIPSRMLCPNIPSTRLRVASHSLPLNSSSTAFGSFLCVRVSPSP